jgi:TatA/E family protein of Tat protein translocase
MALDPTELLIMAAVVVVIFLWGPGKIPEMARSLGRAKKEFDAAQKDIQEVTKQFQAQSGLTTLTSAASVTSSGNILDRLTGLTNMIGEPASAAAAAAAPSAQPLQLPQAVSAAPAAAAPESKSADEVLIDTAKQLGISTAGKTRQEISQEILAKARAAAPSDSSSYSSVPT